jgi:hypothetical protein
LEPSGSI